VDPIAYVTAVRLVALFVWCIGRVG
jgi:hypothetical protein